MLYRLSVHKNEKNPTDNNLLDVNDIDQCAELTEHQDR